MPESEASFTVAAKDYKDTFDHPAGHRVLAELRWYAYAKIGEASNRLEGHPLFHTNPFEMGRRVGRFEVFDRIRHYAKVPEEQIDFAEELLAERIEFAQSKEESDAT